MGCDLSTQQLCYAEELQRILQEAECSVELGHIEHFIKEIECRCPWYPEQGSLKQEDWTRMGQKLHEKPQASTQNLWLWWRCQDAIGKISIVEASPKASSLITPVPSAPPSLNPQLALPTSALTSAESPPPAYDSPTKKIEQSTVRAAVATAKRNEELSIEDMQEFEGDLHAFPVTYQQGGDGNVIAEWTSLSFSVSSPSISSVPIEQLTTENPLPLGSLSLTTPLSSFSLEAIIPSLPPSAPPLPVPEDSCRSAFQETVEEELKQSNLPSENDAKSNSLVKHHSSPSFLSPEKANFSILPQQKASLTAPEQELSIISQTQISFALLPVNKQPSSALQTMVFAILPSGLVSIYKKLVLYQLLAIKKTIFDPGIPQS